MVSSFTSWLSPDPELVYQMFVFGEVQEPIPETAHLVEDIVRSQIIELVRSSSFHLNYHSNSAADRASACFSKQTRVAFRLCRGPHLPHSARQGQGQPTPNLSFLEGCAETCKGLWRRWRRSSGSGGTGGGRRYVSTLCSQSTPLIHTLDKINAGKAQKITIKLSWEVATIYSDILKDIGHQSDDEEDEDDLEAHEASIQRLKEADDATRQMTREEYQHYSDCRQASFTYRKGKRFREFLNLPPHLDLRANDDTVDIVGFLAFEMVRSLTLAGLAVKKSLEESVLRDDYQAPSKNGKRKAASSSALGGPSEKRRREDDPDDEEYTMPVNTLFLPPVETRTALRPEHIQDAFSRMQAEWSHSRSAGMNNWRGGLVRTRISLI